MPVLWVMVLQTSLVGLGEASRGLGEPVASLAGFYDRHRDPGSGAGRGGGAFVLADSLHKHQRGGRPGPARRWARSSSMPARSSATEKASPPGSEQTSRLSSKTSMPPTRPRTGLVVRVGAPFTR